ncbi:carbohydrate kinase family protein [Butyrivibrio sp.]|jgi:ribokinase|uniref:carbohydrate kinase family protein n=1 Tax=Butyrivibrio sp. TaxID=28121 RepID=UPI0025B9B83F|nr:carbohydrate kinase family protein [Butyrivibrio sp.]MBE5836962.1 carbohydrate kinase family protein [Butyrivibrio sp.]MBQ6414675.1 carbohydrate kinase family protein [Butyrivibrio sp.]
MSKFLVAGVTQIETIVRVDKIPVSYAPLSNVQNSIYTAMGGDAYNESLALKWLGDDVTFMSIVGRNQDLGLINPPDRRITLSTDYIIPQMQETPTEVVLYDKERKQQIFEDIKDLRENVYDMNVVTPIAGACDMMVLANANFCRPFAKTAAELGKPIAVNIRSYNPEKEKYNTDFLEPAKVLYFSDDTLSEDPYDFIDRMASTYGTEIIILGQGSEGLILFDKTKDIKAHYKTVKTNEVVNTIGAGNALFACFLHFYMETGDSVNAIKNALLFASYKIGYMGTSNGFMTVDQLEQWRNLIWGIKKTPFEEQGV